MLYLFFNFLTDLLKLLYGRLYLLGETTVDRRHGTAKELRNVCHGIALIAQFLHFKNFLIVAIGFFFYDIKATRRSLSFDGVNSNTVLVGNLLDGETFLKKRDDFVVLSLLFETLLLCLILCFMTTDTEIWNLPCFNEKRQHQAVSFTTCKRTRYTTKRTSVVILTLVMTFVDIARLLELFNRDAKSSGNRRVFERVYEKPTNTL